MGFLKFLFPVCFFWYFLLFGSVDIQHFTIRKQILKKKIMMIVGACIFLVAAAQALPLFFRPLIYRSSIKEYIMSGEVNENQYVSYPMFKGLQKPLEFMGFQGRYITWAACAVGGAILGFIIAYCILGFVVGLVVLAVSLCSGAALIFFKQ